MILPVNSPQNPLKTSHGGQQVSQRTCPGANYERRPVIMGHQPQWVTDQKWRIDPSKYTHILLPDKFGISFYIIQLKWLCLSHAETPLA